jgi:hypothetical protein
LRQAHLNTVSRKRKSMKSDHNTDGNRSPTDHPATAWMLTWTPFPWLRRNPLGWTPREPANQPKAVASPSRPGPPTGQAAACNWDQKGARHDTIPNTCWTPPAPPQWVTGETQRLCEARHHDAATRAMHESFPPLTSLPPVPSPSTRFTKYVASRGNASVKPETGGKGSTTAGQNVPPALFLTKHSCDSRSRGGKPAGRDASLARARLRDSDGPPAVANTGFLATTGAFGRVDAPNANTE